MSKRYCPAVFLWLLLVFAGIPLDGKSQNDSLAGKPAGDSLAILKDSVFSETGIASWYGKAAEGRMTASGEIFHADSLTAAHKTLPMGTLVRVTNLANDSVVIVKVNDRLPKSNRKRCIDLSSGAARQLNYLRAGTTTVRIEVIGQAPIHPGRKRRS